MRIGLVNLLMGCWCLLINGSCSTDNSGDDGTEKEQELEVLAPVAIPKDNSTKVYMHYMTWFETAESSANSQWGYHWTMANRNPNIMDANGKREIASHFYPLIGPYHSGDRDVIENHLLLMKYAGVDGILIDWYGTYNVNDYAMIKENTDQVIAVLETVGLEYAIVYEDRFLQNIVDAGLAPSVESAAKKDLQFLKEEYLTDANYIHIDDKPLLLNFGPITLQDPESWGEVFSVLDEHPTFLTLWNQSHQAGASAQGEYTWVYQNNTFLKEYYEGGFQNLTIGMGGAYPGFVDFYKEGGTSTNIGFTIAHSEGKTLDETLDLAIQYGVEYLQLITWNDFGECTMLEPTEEFGYRYMEKIKDFTEVRPTSAVFEDIGMLYQLRKTHKNSMVIQKELDQAFYYLVSLQPERAKELLNQYQ